MQRILATAALICCAALTLGFGPGTNPVPTTIARISNEDANVVVQLSNIWVTKIEENNPYKLRGVNLATVTDSTGDIELLNTTGITLSVQKYSTITARVAIMNGKRVLVDPQSGVDSTRMWLYGAAGVLVVLIAVLVVMLLGGKKSSELTDLHRTPLPPPPPPLPIPGMGAGGGLLPPPPSMAIDDRTRTTSGPPRLADDRTIVAQPAAPIRAELQVLAGEDRQTNSVLPLGLRSMLLGRDKASNPKRKNDIKLLDSTVSAEQAKIVYDEAKACFVLINESATNPTQVNGQKIQTWDLREGDRIACGNVEMEFHLR